MLSSFHLWLILLGLSCTRQLPVYSIQAHYGVYSAVIDGMSVGKRYSFVLVADSTGNWGFQNYDLKKPKEWAMDTTTLEAILVPQWEGFLALIDIDLSKLKPIPLQAKFDTSTKIRFKSQVPDFYHLGVYKQERYKDAEGLVTFTPVCVSHDGKKAVCGINVVHEPEDAYTAVLFLEKQPNGSWNVIAHAFTSIS